MHCTENPIYVLPEKKPRALSPSFCERFIYSHDRSTFFWQQNRQTDRGNIYIAHRSMNVGVGWGLSQCSFISGNICFEFSVYCLCSVPGIFSSLVMLRIVFDLLISVQLQMEQLFASLHEWNARRTGSYPTHSEWSDYVL